MAEQTIREDPAALAELRQRLINWQPDLTGTLVFVCQGEQVLLIHKKSGVGTGLINGPGGKLLPGESPASCARRELEEELEVRVEHLWPVATLRFVDTDSIQWLGYAFLAAGLRGTPTETDEARPVWYPRNRLPLENMWPDNVRWLPQVLDGECLQADFLGSNGKLLASQSAVSGSWSNRWV